MVQQVAVAVGGMLGSRIEDSNRLCIPAGGRPAVHGSPIEGSLCDQDLGCEGGGEDVANPQAQRTDADAAAELADEGPRPLATSWSASSWFTGG